MKNLIKNTTNLLFRKQTNILSAATIIAAAVLFSRILGLLKFRLLNDHFSVSQIGLFWAAFRLPNTVFDLIVMGALTAAFIPVFTSYIAHNKEQEAHEIASTIINISSIFFLVISLVLLVFADQIVRLITPGLSSSEMATVSYYTRVMLIGQTFPLILGNFLTGILQSYKRFLWSALAPVAYNAGIILGIVLFSANFGLMGAVIGVIIGSIFFFLIQLPAFLHLKFHYSFKINLRLEGVKKIGNLIVPRAFGLAVNQLNYTVNLAVSSLLSSRAIAIFNYAQQLEQLPVSIFAATIAQAALPTLSEEQHKDDNFLSFKKTFSSSFLQVMFLVLPAAAILIILRIPIVRLVYGATKFDWYATVDTGRTLAFLAAGLAAESAIQLLVRAFFALQDSKTPVTVGIVTVLVNIILSIIFIPILKFPIWGLGFAVAIADSLQAIILFLFLRKQVGFAFREIVFPFIKMVTAAVITAVCLYIPMKLLDQLVFDTTRTIPLIMLTGTATIIGLVVYSILTWVFEIEELRAFVGLFKKAKTILFLPEEVVSEVTHDA